MFTSNPFAELSASIPPAVMQAYIVVMIVLVAGGTLFDTAHKKSAKYFFENWRNAKNTGTQQVSGGKMVSLAIQTAVVEGLTSGEFCTVQRRIAHLLTMYGFLAYVITTAIMVFWYPTPAAPTPAILPLLWYLGALMVCLGGYWFWFFIRVDVAAEGNSPFRIVRADLFILSLLASVTLGLVWTLLQATGNSWTNLFLGLYLIATTVLFGSVPWSKFSHMFFKPAAAFQKRVAEANGSRSNLPGPADKPDDTTYRRAYNIEPNMCWECYSCVKACPQNAIDCRGYADFAPLGHSVRVLREEAKGTISWKIKFRNGNEKNFVSPIRTTPWGSIKSPADYEAPSREAMKSQELAHEPDALNIDKLPALNPDQLKQGVV